MSLVSGVYKQTGQNDQVMPILVDDQGRLQTTATATVSSEVEISNDSGNPIPIEAVQRTCVGHQTIAATTGSATALTIPAGAVAALIQADGSAVSIRLDGVNPTATSGLRLDDGMMLYVDGGLALVSVIAKTTATNVQVAYYDKA